MYHTLVSNEFLNLSADMKSILLFVIGVLRTQLVHAHLFLLIVIANRKLLINPRVDPFFSLLSLLKTTMKIFFFFCFLPYSDF